MAGSLVHLHNISKRFPGVLALDGVSFDIGYNEVHAVIGENGAGKSTLMRILAGAEIADEGEFSISGKKVSFKTPLDAQKQGIGIVYQELSLFPNLSIAENIFANRQPDSLGLVRRSKLEQQSRILLDLFNFEFQPNTPLRLLDMADRQRVEILRAVSQDPKLLILDEPTSSLTESEIERLFELIGQLRERGISVLYVSHQLQEVMRLSDRITVLRDGAYIDTVERGTADEADLVRMMVGRAVDLYRDYQFRESENQTAIEVRGLSCEGAFSDISFELYRGEILGFAGLVGAGRTELAKAMFGLLPHIAGTMALAGQPFRARSPQEAIHRGLAYVPEDRKLLGLFLEMLLRDNVIVPQLKSVSRFGLLDNQRIDELARMYIERIGIVARSPRQSVKTLSGGNQQKLMLSMWLAVEPSVLIVDEPTRGIDVGAKVDIHDLLHELASEGMAIMLISSELPEVLSMSDRIAVMRQGRLEAVLSKHEATQERIISIASGAERAKG